MKARRMRAATSKTGQEVEVGPKGPGLRQSQAELARGNVRTERGMHGQPGSDGRVKPEEARRRIL